MIDIKEKHLNKLLIKSFNRLVDNIKIDNSFNNDYYKIYGLIDEFNNELFYIGCTIINPLSRLKSHFSYRMKDQNKRDKLLFILWRCSNIKIKIFYQTKDEIKAKIIEQILINFLSNNNHTINLVNIINTDNINKNLEII